MMRIPISRPAARFAARPLSSSRRCRWNSTESTEPTDTTTIAPNSSTPAINTTPELDSSYLTELIDYANKAKAAISARKPKVLLDPLSPMNSHLLNLALQDHLPELLGPKKFGLTAHGYLKPGHHLVYFPIQTRNSNLQPDGTDPDHAPGAPFVRRMWAGGSLHHLPGLQLSPKNGTGFCIESVGEPVLKPGTVAGEEKVFVEVKRQYGIATDLPPGERLLHMAPEELIEKYGTGIEEIRKLVFLRERAPLDPDAPAPPPRIIKSTSTPTFSFSLRPDPTLLFQFSALTYNAHAIHLDANYARSVEGYPERLVHGPLTLVLMLTCLQRYLRHEKLDAKSRKKPTPAQLFHSIQYRNLAPVFVGQEMKVCLRETTSVKGVTGRRGWEVWVEGPEGGMVARGSATTVEVERGSDAGELKGQ